MNMNSPVSNSGSHANPPIVNGGEEITTSEPPQILNVKSSCTQICKGRFSGKSCPKTVLTREFKKDNPGEYLKV